jgi:glycerophosphoryl diester phosphodiesterase
LSSSILQGKGGCMKKMMIGVIFLYCTIAHPVIIIGHRGASGYAPENTLTAFARAIECNVDMVECDVWKCASGELVVFHDAKLERLTDGYGSVSSKTLDELKKLVVLGYERIPTLTELFDFVDRRVKLYVELKGADIAHDVLQLIEHYVEHKQWQYDDFLVASFDHIQLRTIKNINSAIPVAALIYGIPMQLGACAEDINAQVVCLDVEFINQRFVDDIHNRGMLVYVYTVNDRDDFTRLIDYGVDGVVTDYPGYIGVFFANNN